MVFGLWSMVIILNSQKVQWAFSGGKDTIFRDCQVSVRGGTMCHGSNQMPWSSIYNIFSYCDKNILNNFFAYLGGLQLW